MAIVREKSECFVIMPISDPEGYEKGHFRHVYNDIIKASCEEAGYTPIRADDVNDSGWIHADILTRLIETPMAICDLSSRNPNVLFELGVRQAFDKPTVLIQEEGTPKIFDIGIFRIQEYRKSLKYATVLEDRVNITKAILATNKGFLTGNSIQSLISLLSLNNAATLNGNDENDASNMLQLVRAEISELKKDIRGSIKNPRNKTYNKVDFITEENLPFSIEILYSESESIKKLIENNIGNRVILERRDSFIFNIDQLLGTHLDEELYTKLVELRTEIDRVTMAYLNRISNE